MPHRSPIVVALTATSSLAVLLAARAGAQLRETQLTTEQKIPRVGHGVASWQVKRTDPGAETYFIRVRNDTTVPIEVTRIHLSNCLNLGVPCDSLTPVPVVVAPGGSEELMSFTPAIPGRTTRFTDRIAWRAVPECLNADTITAARLRRTAPSSRQMVMPPAPWPHRLDATSVQISFFVGASGRADSVRVAGLVDSSYLARLDSATRGYAFEPARVGKCPVPGTAQISLMFGSSHSP